jgi:hypothetical protein
LSYSSSCIGMKTIIAYINHNFGDIPSDPEPSSIHVE